MIGHTAARTGSSSGGCGCGGGATHPCSCGTSQCQECKTSELVRPHFFAGQLLTEDDLETLTTYVVEKQRLHTRYLHGWGVVCGLEVLCDPCGGGTVRVRPGYALDCCGNDIVVPCETELDILAMIRQLVIERRGKDCGDPCADAKTRADRALGTPARTAANRLTQTGGGDDDKPPLSRRFCLYLNYCEQSDDPVKPYTIEEPCGGAACEHARVREGYRFELRCEETPIKEPSIEERIEMCAKPDEVKKEMAAAESRSVRYDYLERAIAIVGRNEPLSIEPRDIEAFRRNLDIVARFEKEFPETDLNDETAPKPAETRVREAVDAYVNLGRWAAKVRTAEASGVRITDAARKQAEEARAKIEEAQPLMRSQVDALPTAEERLVGNAGIAEANRWSAPDVTPDTRRSAQSLLFIAGALFPQEVSTYDAQQLSELRDWLLRRLDAGAITDCRLRREVEQVKIDAAGRRTESSLAESRRTLDELLERYIRQCVCTAILPPCPPCDDPGVLLACLTVEECEVVDICNLERRFVLTWPLMRFWIPWIGRLGEDLEEQCCPSTEKKAEKWYRKRELPETPTLTEYTFTNSAGAVLAASRRSSLEGMMRFTARSSEGAGTVERLAQLVDRSILPRPGEMPLAIERAIAPGSDRLAEALKAAEPRAVLNELIADGIETLRPREEIAAVASGFDAQLAGITRQLGDVQRELRKRPTAAALPQAAPFKRVVDANKRLGDINAELAKKVQDLEERILHLEGTGK